MRNLLPPNEEVYPVTKPNTQSTALKPQASQMPPAQTTVTFTSTSISSTSSTSEARPVRGAWAEHGVLFGP